MKQRIVYYFTGSGNSLYIAKELASATDGEILPINVLKEGKPPGIEYYMIGFVLPVYDFKAPVFVKACVRRAIINDDAYIFCVATYGLSAGRTINEFQSLIAGKGQRLNYGITIPMPHNGVCSAKAPEKKMMRRLSEASGRIKKITAMIVSGNDYIESAQSVVVGMFKSGIIRMFPGLMKFSLIAAVKGINALDKISDEKCTGCGTCSRICPVDNIRMRNGKPEWGDDCANCFGCLHWCPVNAISLGGYEMNVRQYRHPEIKLKDISIY